MHPPTPDHTHSPADVGQERPHTVKDEHRGLTLLRSGTIIWASVIVLAIVFVVWIVMYAAD